MGPGSTVHLPGRRVTVTNAVIETTAARWAKWTNVALVFFTASQVATLQSHPPVPQLQRVFPPQRPVSSPMTAADRRTESRCSSPIYSYLVNHSSTSYSSTTVPYFGLNIR